MVVIVVAVAVVVEAAAVRVAVVVFHSSRNVIRDGKSNRNSRVYSEGFEVSGW